MPNYDPYKTKWTMDEYLYGLRMTESSGDYLAVNPKSGAYGAYQTIPKYLCWYYQSAGVDPATIKDPASQDEMAEYHVRKLYERFGNWDLVSLAWHKGASNAQLVLDTFGVCGPAVTVEDIESMHPGETEYINRVNSFAAEYQGGTNG